MPKFSGALVGDTSMCREGDVPRLRQERARKLADPSPTQPHPPLLWFIQLLLVVAFITK